MKKIGLLVPKTNLTVEYELQTLFANGYFNTNKSAFYVFKLEYKSNYKEDKIKFLEELAMNIKEKEKDLKYINIEYSAFFCTTSSIKNEVNVANPSLSLIEEAKLKSIRKCLLITPYNNELGKEVVNMLKSNGIKVVENLNLNLLHTDEYFDFGINKLEELIEKIYKKKYENIIISCTNLPSINIINKLEKKLNTQIISSNSSLFAKIKRDNNI
ncbi:MAG: hypothetical protein ACLU0X_02365 [Lachnospiraceae bacterium]|jgi:hypothetical protein